VLVAEPDEPLVVDGGRVVVVVDLGAGFGFGLTVVVVVCAGRWWITSALYVTSVVATGAVVGVVDSGTMTAASAGAANTRCRERLARGRASWVTLAGAKAWACTDAADDEP
jgi:hypothetical protein